MAGTADVCIVGMGAVGGIIAKELASAGLKVVGLERGLIPQYGDYSLKDSIHSIVRRSIHESVRHEPVAIRAQRGQRTRMRMTTSQVGGSLMHWTGQSSRFMPGDFKVYTNEVASGLFERAGASLQGHGIADWPLGYKDLEPYYTKYEYEMGVSGQGGENPFAGPRSRDFPLPPLRMTARALLFEEACRRLGYHPYHTPMGILSQAYQPPAPFDQRIPERPACVYCGHCHDYGCHVHAKSSTLYTLVPVALKTGNFELRTQCKVLRINTDARGRVSGVSYFDPKGEVRQQRASVVILAAFLYDNVRLLLLSQSNQRAHAHGLGNSGGMVGRFVMAHGDVQAHGLYDGHIVNAFIGPGASGMRIDDFNGNNFDHVKLGFIRGGTIGTSGSGTPVERYDVIPPGWPTWGEAYKEYLARYYTRSFGLNMQAETLPHQDNSVDLHPTARDAWGLPLPRVTFSFHENERRIQRFLAGVGERIMKETGASHTWTSVSTVANRWAGGTRMGTDPSNSVVDAQCRVHGLDNLFVIGASVFPTMAGYPPTATVAALSYRAADFIRGQSALFR
jgi:gluconate 2-dehydrogenase alpha chain